MRRSFTDSIVVPVANEEDARRTALVLVPYEGDDVTVLYVVEKGERVPDTTPVEPSERVADGSFARFHETFPGADVEVAYRRDVGAALLDVVDTSGRALSSLDPGDTHVSYSFSPEIALFG